MRTIKLKIVSDGTIAGSKVIDIKSKAVLQGVARIEIDALDASMPGLVCAKIYLNNVELKFDNPKIEITPTEQAKFEAEQRRRKRL